MQTEFHIFPDKKWTCADSVWAYLSKESQMVSVVSNAELPEILILDVQC